LGTKGQLLAVHMCWT